MIRQIFRPAYQESEKQLDWLLKSSKRKIRQNNRRMNAQSKARILAMEIQMQELQEKNIDKLSGEQPIVSDSIGLGSHIGWILDRYL